MDPFFSAPAAPRPVPLTPEDRAILARQHFLLVTVYKYILVGLALLFGGGWLWASITALREPDAGQLWLILTVVGVVLVGFGIWSTPIYWKNTATPLTRDLDDERKICLVGEIIEIKYAGSDPARGMKIVLKTPYKADLEEFASSARVAADALVVGSQVALEYTPHARFILWLALRVPLTLEERQQRQTEENTSLAGALLAVSSIVALLLLGMGWWLDLFVPFALITGLMLALVVGIGWLVRR